ncbi:MAG: AIR synthase related protein, partial [Clostridia bacterium]|nr:AIR synthase related protein [Clostridia bacterium]
MLGKLTAEQLNDLIFSRINRTRSETLAGGGVGEDCAALALGDNTIILSSDPITASCHDPGALAVYVCCNDIAAAGAEPVAVLLTLLLPPETE